MPFLNVLFLIFPLSLATIQVEWIGPTEHDFGDIVKGEPVRHAFVFRNEGNDPLVIDNVRTTCGCTTPGWPREAIAQDSTGTIEVEYSARTAGAFHKLVKVYFKGRRKAEKLYISGFVE